MAFDPARCLPILASLDIGETDDFCVNRLGFTGDGYELHDYLIVKRDE